MPQRLTSLQIQARLEGDIARHPACCGFRVEVQVRRLEHGLGRYRDWIAEFHAIGETRGRSACATALREILESARDECTLSLDS